MKPLIRLFTKSPVWFFILLLVSRATSAACDIQPVTIVQAPGFKHVDQAPRRNLVRQSTIEAWWEDRCPNFRRMDLPSHRTDNLVCRIPGKHPETIVVGAHFDKVQQGRGVADNWSGVVVLDALLNLLQTSEPHYTIELVAFAAEEPGLFGSKAYLKQYQDPLVAMVNLDTLGLQSLIIAGESDPLIACKTLLIAKTLGISAVVKSWRDITGDWEVFAKAGIPVVSLQSVDTKTIKRIHHRRDRAGNADLELISEAFQVAANLVMQLANPEEVSP